MTIQTKKSSEGPHRDRVAQVYFGMLKWGAAGDILRQRIDWMVDQARGPRILDVGCSEGVLEILLARKGFDVTGVDINAEALAFARDLLAQESEEIRSRVRIIQGDLAQTRLLEDQFDTLVMGEILEHLEDPQELLCRSLDLIRPEGRVIITTPFGYHPDEDHRQTFCLSDLITLVKPRCALEHLEVEGGYIRIVGCVSHSTESSWQQLTDDQLLGMTEASLVSAQQHLYGNIHRYKKRIDTLEQQVQERKDKTAKLQNNLKEERTRTARLQQDVAEELTRATKLRQRVEKGHAEASELQRKFDEEQAKASELQQRVEDEEAKASKLRCKVKEGQVRASELQGEVEKARRREEQVGRSIRWQLGTLLVDAVRRPWRTIRLPFDIVRLSLFAVNRRYSNSISNGSGPSPLPPSSSIVPRRSTTSTAPAATVKSVAAQTPRRPVSLVPSGDQMTEWIIDQVEGPRIAVIGCDSPGLRDSLHQLRFDVTTYQFDLSVLEPELVKQEHAVTPQWDPSTNSANKYSHSKEKELVDSPSGADTAIICGTPHAEPGPENFLSCIRYRLSRHEAKVIILQSQFSAFQRDESPADFSSLLKVLRSLTVPEHLSLANGELRFVGRFGQPSTGAWTTFEAGLWPELTHEVVESLQWRQNREISAAEQRVQDLLESTSYRAGQILVAAAKEPRTLWKVPLRLWRLYQATRLPIQERRRVVPSRNTEPSMNFAELAVPAPPDSRAPVVATILDTFTEFCLRYEADLVLLSPKHWKQQLERTQPAMLLVESAWAGNSGAWRHLITNYNEREVNPLRELLAYCNDHNIPTVFWNKEDPPNFDVFVDAAVEFNHIFTTDADCIPKYKELCGHDHVYLMQFASQPRLHNPCRENTWPRYPVCFAGSWMEKYPERKKSLQDLLEPALSFGLHIFDRNFERPGYTSSNYRFPDRYQSAIRGSLNYKQMLAAYRCYDVMMNVNSVTRSPTMFSRRVFESLACGTPVISTDSTGLRSMLGEHVRITNSQEDTAAHLSELLNDEEKRMREGHRGCRYVHEHHTYRLRITEMFLRVGLEPPVSVEQSSVSVITTMCRPENVECAVANYSRQCYEFKELVLVLHGAIFDMNALRAQVRNIDNVHILEIQGRTTLGECFNRGVEAASGMYIAKMDDDSRYGERYLADSMLAADFSHADILGKGTYFVHVESKNITALRPVRPVHEFTDIVAEGSLTAPRDIWKRFPLSDQTGGDDSIMLANARKGGCRIYSSDAFNFLQIRVADTKRHASKLEDDEYLKNCQNLQSGLELSRVMI